MNDTIGPAIDSVYVNNLHPSFRYYSRMRYWIDGNKLNDYIYYYDGYDSMSVMTSGVDWLLVDILDDVVVSDTFISINWFDVDIEEFGCSSCEFMSRQYIVELSYDTIVGSIISVINIVDTFHSFGDLVPGEEYHYRILGVYMFKINIGVFIRYRGYRL